MNAAGRLVFVGVPFLALAVGSAFLLRSGVYGWSLFVVTPVLVGALASWVTRPRSAGSAIATGAVANAAALSLFLLMGWEGLICVAMAAPLAIPLGVLGAWVVFHFRETRIRPSGMAMLLLVPGASLSWDVKAKPDVFEVKSSVEIAATPEQVWKNVVSFSDLPEPRQWFFRAGLAYPKRARIEGSGPGAIRYCEFSTGPFVEPIELWDEPRLLRFRVTENPAPMNEWSPYAHVLPRHLHGYFISKRGQFQLTRLPNNHTLLEGTTWYQHGLWPAQYWRWWSQAIIHQIHLRVLNHIRVLSEAGA